MSLKKKIKRAWCHDRLFETPRTVVRQAPLSMGFPQQEYWSELPFPSSVSMPFLVSFIMLTAILNGN